MKKRFLVLFLIISNFLFSQNNINYSFRAKYKLTSKISSKIPNKQEEAFFLFFNEKESFFISEKDYVRDSIKLQNISGKYDLSAFVRFKSFFSDRIYTSLRSDDNIKLTFLKYRDSFFGFTNDSLKRDWKINGEKKTIRKIQCVNANINMLGRQWNAYYSQDYPFPFGPFQFDNLPGLIISVKDSEGIFEFELIELKKTNISYKLEKIDKFVSKEDYYKLLKEMNFGTQIFNKFSTPDDPNSKVELQKKFESQIKKIDNFPIDKTMRYIFD